MYNVSRGFLRKGNLEQSKYENTTTCPDNLCTYTVFLYLHHAPLRERP
jgi:hypothetical protein